MSFEPSSASNSARDSADSSEQPRTQSLDDQPQPALAGDSPNRQRTTRSELSNGLTRWDSHGQASTSRTRSIFVSATSQDPADAQALTDHNRRDSSRRDPFLVGLERDRASNRESFRSNAVRRNGFSAPFTNNGDLAPLTEVVGYQHPRLEQTRSAVFRYEDDQIRDAVRVSDNDHDTIPLPEKADGGRPLPKTKKKLMSRDEARMSVIEDLPNSATDILPNSNEDLLFDEEVRMSGSDHQIEKETE